MTYDRRLGKPTMVDIDDIDSSVSAQLLRTTTSASANPLNWLRRLARNLFVRGEIHRWRHSERVAQRYACTVVACSQDDALQMRANGARLVVVAPNGYDRTGPAMGRQALGEPQTVGFWGLISYSPNREGAKWFIDSVLPIVRESIPDIRFAVAGAGSEQLQAFDPRIECLGRIPAMEPFLINVDVAVVPLLAGGGTRIKIIEAWAHGIPVVSTTIGIHGLDPRPGENALVADTPQDFANAIVQALSDTELRGRLRAGGSLSARSFLWAAFRKEIANAAVETAARR